MLQDFTGKDKLNVVIKSFNKIWQPAKFAVYVKQNYSLFFSPKLTSLVRVKMKIPLAIYFAVGSV